MGEILYVKDYLNKFADIGTSRDVIGKFKLLCQIFFLHQQRMIVELRLLPHPLGVRVKHLYQQILPMYSSKFEKSY